MACDAGDPAVGGGDVEVAGAAADAAHVAYPGGGVGEAFQLLHSDRFYTVWIVLKLFRSHFSSCIY